MGRKKTCKYHCCSSILVTLPFWFFLNTRQSQKAILVCAFEQEIGMYRAAYMTYFRLFFQWCIDGKILLEQRGMPNLRWNAMYLLFKAALSIVSQPLSLLLFLFHTWTFGFFSTAWVSNLLPCLGHMNEEELSWLAYKIYKVVYICKWSKFFLEMYFLLKQKKGEGNENKTSGIFELVSWSQCTGKLKHSTDELIFTLKLPV